MKIVILACWYILISTAISCNPFLTTGLTHLCSRVIAFLLEVSQAKTMKVPTLLDSPCVTDEERVIVMG